MGWLCYSFNRLIYIYIKLLLVCCIGICSIHSNAQTVADFTYATTGDSCNTRSVRFTDASRGAINSYNWKFRNITFGFDMDATSERNPSINFLEAGIYEVTLTVTSPDGVFLKTARIKVYKSPKVDFSVDPNQGCIPLQVSFIDKTVPGDAPLASWNWDFGDGNKKTSTDPTSIVNTYKSAGVYSPTLTVKDQIGCSAKRTIDSLVQALALPTLTFDVKDNVGCTVPATVRITNPVVNPRFQYVWEFGDGDILRINDQNFTHEYRKVGIFKIKLTAISLDGKCSTSVTSPAAKSANFGKPKADFSLPSTVCLGSSLSLAAFNDVNNVGNAGTWLFGDDNTSVSALTASHVFGKVGLHEVKFVSYNSLSRCADTMTKTIQVLPVPVSDFKIDNPSGCKVPHIAHFENQSVGAAKYIWDFGDGLKDSLSGSSSLDHQYLKYSTYSVTLKAIGANGCAQSKSKSVSVAQLSLNTTVSPTEGCLPLNVKVSASGVSQPVTSYDFNFGDNKSVKSSLPNASHIYTTQGDFDLTVSVATTDGCTAKSTAKKIRVNEYCTTVADSITGKGSFGGGLFVKRSSYDCSKKYTFDLYDTLSTADLIGWRLGAQEVATTKNPLNYTFPKDQKKYLVTAVLRDKVTGDSILHKVTVKIVDEKANFRPNLFKICKGTAVNFLPIGIDSSLILKYIWDFGDGGPRKVIDNKQSYSSTGKYQNGKTTYSYAKDGIYRPKLIIMDVFGCLDSLQYPMPIEVKAAKASFKVDQTKFCERSFNVVFKESFLPALSAPIKKWTWDFGDNTKAVYTKDTIVSHLYNNTTASKNYLVSLTVEDSVGCIAKKDTVLESSAPKAEFWSQYPTKCYKIGVDFESKSVAAVAAPNTQYTWKFGDGTTGVGTTPSHVYKNPGKYSVTLIVKDNSGCIDSVTKVDYVNLVQPKASFEVGEDTSTCFNSLARPFTNNSEYAIVGSSWDFGDGIVVATNQKNVSHTYKKSGVYRVKLTVTGHNLCTDTVSKLITIKGTTAELVVNKKYMCLGDTFSAVVKGKNIKSFGWDFSDLSSTSHLATKDSVAYVFKRPGRYYPNVILVSTSNCKTILTLQDPILVDSIGTFKSANIECGSTHTQLTGRSVLNVPNQYVWEGPNGANYLPNDSVLTPKVNLPGVYRLRVKDGLCKSSDSVVVTSSGVIPVVNAGADSKIDCFTSLVELHGSTATANTKLKWTGPAGTYFLPIDTLGDIRATKPGMYILIGKQKDCLGRDTVYVDTCAFNGNDMAVNVCANKSGVPARFRGISGIDTLRIVKEEVDYDKAWFLDELLTKPITNLLATEMINGGRVYAKVWSKDKTDSTKAIVTFRIKAMPKAPTISPRNPICQGSTQIIKASGAKANTYFWGLSSDSTLSVQPSTSDSIRFIVGTSNIEVKVVEIDSQGCGSDTGRFVLPVDSLPTKALVNGASADTMEYCITDLEKRMPGNKPFVGKGSWTILYNPGHARISTPRLGDSPLLSFTNLKDTLVAEWSIKNGSCPVSKAVATILPAKAFIPEVLLKAPPFVCGGTVATFTATPVVAGGKKPLFTFYNDHNQLVRQKDSANVLYLKATQDTTIYVKIHSNYECLIKDTAFSQKLTVKWVSQPEAEIITNGDTLCEDNGPILLRSKQNQPDKAIVHYEWYLQDLLISKRTSADTLLIDQPENSGMYTLKVYNDYCPASFARDTIKLYEKPVLSFATELLEVPFGLVEKVELPLDMAPLKYPAEISYMKWSPTDYLARFDTLTGMIVPLGDSIQVRPYFIAQSKEFPKTYTFMVVTGPAGKGCKSEASILVRNYLASKVPNAFSPNGDGLNDYWMIDGILKYPLSKVKLFNRWGDLLFEDNAGYQIPWDGRVNGAEIAVGTYYYIIEYLGSTDKSDYTSQGSITVVR